MISKELLSEVLSPEICIGISDVRGEVLKFWLWQNGEEAKHYINIYELAHLKLKQWAKLNNVFDLIDWSVEPEQIFAKAEELRNYTSLTWMDLL